VCYDWRKALRDQESLVAHSSIIECESDGESFDLGGWLAVRNHHLMFEIKDRAYVVALNDDNRIQDVERPTRASYALLNSSAAHLAVAISFMAFSDDAIMTTYTVRSTSTKSKFQQKETNMENCRLLASANPLPTFRVIYTHPSAKTRLASSRQKLFVSLA
jgi:hypothetical protein